jgi:transposase
MTTMPTPPTNPQAQPKARKVYTKEFKIQAVALAKRPGMGFRQAAADLGINESMLRAWAKSAEAEGPEAFRGHGVRTELEARLAALERENRILREERDILKKATEFFVKERR